VKRFKTYLSESQRKKLMSKKKQKIKKIKMIFLKKKSKKKSLEASLRNLPIQSPN
jgi:hypothetical protein